MVFQIKQPKKPKEDSIFEIEKEKLEPDKSLFEMPNDEDNFIEELNEDLYSEQSPIKVKDNYTLLIKAGGQEHKITRKDVAEYNRKYSLEDGSDGREVTAFRSLGTINGNYEMINDISKEANQIFGRLDEHSGSFKTIPNED